MLSELKNLRSDCSCGPDNIPVKFIKLVAEHLASPLTHILNNCIAKSTFPSLWKIARISAIPKEKEIKCNDDLRPISILPTLSKVYERLVLRQMAGYLSRIDGDILKNTSSAYRKGHNTTSVLLAVRDDIIRAMSKGEVTMAVLADFSKAFDTVAYEIVLNKLHKQGFSKSFLKWVTNYMTRRKQFVQIDDKKSSELSVNFGVPQGSILGPVLFNLYVNDLSDGLGSVKTYQYADDTTIYQHCKPIEIKSCEMQLQQAMDKLSSWSSDCNLNLNSKKTKAMIFSTYQLANSHQLKESQINISVENVPLERTTTTKLLGTYFHENLQWNCDILQKISKCYGTLSAIKKLKNFTPFHVRKQLAESLILSVIDDNDVVCHPVPDYLIKRVQRVQLAAASFVVNHYASISDVLKLGWLPVKYRKDFHVTKLIFKALYRDDWPSYLPLEIYKPGRYLRSSNELKLVVPSVKGTFEHTASKIFNSLPTKIRTCNTAGEFHSLCKNHFMTLAKAENE